MQRTGGGTAPQHRWAPIQAPVLVNISGLPRKTAGETAERGRSSSTRHLSGDLLTVPGRRIRLLVGRASAYDPLMQWLPAEVRRGQLIEAALVLAAQQGVTALTIRRGAEAAGVSLAVVHDHGREDREELFTEMAGSLNLADSESMRTAFTCLLIGGCGRSSIGPHRPPLTSPTGDEQEGLTRWLPTST